MAITPSLLSPPSSFKLLPPLLFSFLPSLSLILSLLFFPLLPPPFPLPPSTGTPKHIDYEEVKADLNAVPGVKQAHSLHIWSLTLNRTALAAHLVLGRLLAYPRSGVSCNRSGHYGWNQFFNLLKESLLELQTDRRRLLFDQHSFLLKEPSWPSQISSKVPIPILPTQEKYLNVCAAQHHVLWCLGFAQFSCKENSSSHSFPVIFIVFRLLDSTKLAKTSGTITRLTPNTL